uniref:Uncharacterized protein n=1 Tax=Candidatus Kentrum sp. MB TaxID=2138164 RepID=A0A450XWL6_9GAMM|nr:MAG: hypothetical protein BECKMB1821G_GA0114241_10505 [Candidatus Kentron sp. MB]VFK33627.1 MAG: hypothetical protein BECKMB1821I_GA0114274_10504 [Candidatus Kentron sp. MB]VFK76335.1 MAG: hypothetical protein BECKMB1821H_GA0114242_10524 [Candidatus Kentron sp. MB]
MDYTKSVILYFLTEVNPQPPLCLCIIGYAALEVLEGTDDDQGITGAGEEHVEPLRSGQKTQLLPLGLCIIAAHHGDDDDIGLPALKGIDGMDNTGKNVSKSLLQSVHLLPIGGEDGQMLALGQTPFFLERR